jgi:hypothetical protein
VCGTHRSPIPPGDRRKVERNWPPPSNHLNFARRQLLRIKDPGGNGISSKSGAGVDACSCGNIRSAPCASSAASSRPQPSPITSSPIAATGTNSALGLCNRCAPIATTARSGGKTSTATARRSATTAGRPIRAIPPISLLEEEARQAVKRGEINRAVKGRYMEDQLVAWGIWPLDLINIHQRQCRPRRDR